MKIGLSTLLFIHNSVEESVRTIADLGSECVEIVYDVPHFLHERDKKKLVPIREIVKSNKLDVSIHGSFWDLNPASHHEKVWEASLEQTKLSIDACYRLNGKIVALHPGRVIIPELEWFMRGAIERYLRLLNECLAYARDRGVKIALENVNPPYSTYHGLEELSKLVEGQDDLGICLDIGHAYRGLASRVSNPEIVIANAVKKLRKQIIHIHLHDNHGEDDEHLVPGKGAINFGPIVDAIKKIQYSNMIIIELFDPVNSVETGRAGLNRTMEMLKR